jgi:hypothetical protein
MNVEAEPRIPCPVCREPVHPKARRCNKCQRYLRGPRTYMDVSQTTLAFLSAIGSAIAAVFAWGSSYLDRDSRTNVTFLSATQSVITISAANAGKSPSVIRAVWITFGEAFPVREQELELYQETGDRTDSNAVPASGSATVRYRARGLVRTVSYEELKRRLIADREKVATLVVHIQESDDSREKPTTVREEVPLHRLAEFIRARAPQQQGTS